MASVTEVPADGLSCRYFLTQMGVGVPSRLVEPLDEAQVSNRNCFIRAWYDKGGQFVGFDKLVYGEVELAHRYAYHADGVLARAEVRMGDEEPVVLLFEGTASRERMEAPAG